MEKFAKQALADGVQNADDIQVSKDSELYRTLNLHYNRNNHIEVRSQFSNLPRTMIYIIDKISKRKRDQVKFCQLNIGA